MQNTEYVPPACAWAIVVGLLFFGLSAIGLLDAFLYVRGKTTVTSFLRTEPSLFFYPLAVLQTWIAILAIHLYATR